MVAVISGNGLGLSNTSLTQLGQTSGGQTSLGQAKVGQYLNLATGNLVLQNSDEGLQFDGLPLNVLRTYNSQGQLTGNQGWLFGFSRNLGAVTGTLNTAGSTIARTADDGSVVIYAYNASLGVYVSQGQNGTADTLSWNATTSTWTWTDGASRVQETYSATGQLRTLSDPESGASYSFGYNASNQLSTITAGDGESLSLGYTNGALTSLSISEIPPGGATAVVRQQVQYGYDSQGRLQTVTTTLASDTNSGSTASYTTTYTYDGTSDRVASVSQSDGTTVSYTYAQDSNGNYRVATITTGSGAAAQTLTLGYTLSTDTTTVTDGLGHVTTYTYNAAGQLVQVVAPTFNGSSPTTKYQYDGNGNLLQVTDANGGIIAYTYDANGNRLSVEDPTGHTVSYTYNADNQITSQTTYSVPAQGVAGQSGYVAPSGAQTTYYVYDGSDRLNYVIDALGNVTEHDYAISSGVTVLASTKQYVGVQYNLSGLSPSAPPTLAQLQSWVAGSPVQGTLSQMTRTDYSYDVRGQLSQSIQWDSLNSSGAGTLSGDVGATVITYSYDAQGRLLHSATERGSARTTLETTSYTYDGLGRLLSLTDPLGNVTSYVYTDSGNQLAITQANGLTTTQVRNSAGLLLSSTQSASGQTSRVTSYLYNAAGQPVATIDPLGNISYSFYDADGRLAGTVDATGAVTAYTYDADGHVVATTQYATLISTAGWVSAGALTASYPTSLPVPAASASDRTVHALYDAAGRVIATIDAVGNVATTAYDGDGNAISCIAYATPLTSAQLVALGSSPTWSALQADLTTSANDRTTRTVYDVDNRAAADIDAAGYVTVRTYDTAGRVIQSVAYATALTSAQITALGSAPTLSAVQTDLTSTALDQSTRTYYDGIGRVVAQVDANGYLTVIAYDQTSHTTVTTRYATALTATQLSALTGKETTAALVGLLGSNTGNQQSRCVYDADGRKLTETAVDGTVTGYVYNGVGQLLSATVTPASGQGTARTTSATYDAFGDTLTSVDGNGKSTTYAYNTLGQRITSTDPQGNIIYAYYDADGRIAYTVQGQPNGSTLNAWGNVTAYTYNAFGQVATRRQYAGQLTLTTSSASSGTTLNVSTAVTTQVAAAAAALANPATDNTVTYSYTLDGQVAGTIDGLGYQVAYQYDAFGDLLQSQQQLSQAGQALGAANSTITNYSYDLRGERVGETDGVGTGVARSASNTYDAFGRVTSTTDGNGNAVTYTYDNLGRQISTSQTVQGVARTTYVTYDAFARVVTQTDALNNQTTYQYDLLNHKVIVTTADGVTLTTVRDAFGDTVTVTDGANDVAAYTYDGDGRLLTTKDALGNTSTNQYDADGHLIQTTDATGHVVTYGYDASGRVLTRTADPSGLNLKTSYTYDGEGRRLSVTDPMGSVTTYSYDADGHVLTQVQDAGTGKLNLTTTYTYDGAGKTLTVALGAGTSAARTTQYVYDNLERLSQTIVDPSGLNLVTTYAYDGNNNLLSVTDANGHVTRSVYNEAGQAVFTIDAAGAVTQKTYDADGRITSVRTYGNALTAAQLAALGSNPSPAQVGGAITGSSNDPVSYVAYNAEGQVRYSIDPMGYVTETRYDSADRVSEVLSYATAVSVSASEATVLQQAQGTALSSVASLISGTGNTDASAHATLHLYDADGHERFAVQQNTVNGQLVGLVAEQRYDAAGRIVATVAYGSTLTLSSSQALSTQLTTSSVAQSLASAPSQATYRVYDNAGRLRYAVDATNHVIETQYDADGRALQTIAYANAITLPGAQTVASLASAISATNSGTTGAHINSGTYDAAGRVLTAGDALGTNATFSYDATGLQVGHADRDGNWTWMLYDKAGRKTQEQSPSVTVGSYNSSAAQFQSTTGYLYTTYGYDGVGNVTAVSKGTGPDSAHVTVLSTTSYTYDAVSHQVATTYPGGVGTHVTYNALGQAVVDQDANGHYQYKVYNADGRLAYSVDADGYITGSTYDAYGNVLSTTRYATVLNAGAISGWSAGQPLSLAQVQAGLATSSSDRTITATYDQRSQKIQVQQPSIGYKLTMGALAGDASTGSPTTTYTYDAYGNQTSSSTLIQGALTVGSTSTPAVWATTYNYYDALNRAVMTVTPTGQYTSPQGYVTTTAYDAFGNITSATQYATAISTSGITVATPPGLPPAGSVNTGFDRTTSYQYDSIGRKTTQTFSGEFSYTGGTLGQPNGTAGTAAASSVTQYTYDGESRVTSVTVNGTTTATAYDAAGRVISVTAPARQALVSNWQTLLQQNLSLDLTSSSLYTTVSPVTTNLYDALGNVLTVTVSSGGQSAVTSYFYDALNRQVGKSDALGNWFATAYDNNGNVTSESYTLAGSTATTTYTYDANNQRLSTATQRNGQSGYDQYSQVQYNAFGEITAKGDNNGYEAAYGYNNAGQCVSGTDAKTGALHTFSYDLANHLMVDAYTVTGGSSTIWTANTLDMAGRTLTRVTPSSSAATGENAPQLHYTYDRWSNVTSLTDEAGNATQFFYTSLNQVIQENEPTALVVSATGTRTWQTPSKEWYYNINGQLMGATDENSNSSWNTYDTGGNLTVAQDNIGNKTYTVYDALGRAVAQQTPPANTVTGPVAHITYTNYDNLNRVVQQGDFLLNTAGTGRTQQAQQTYVLDINGDRAQVTDALGNTSYYTYDSQHRVLSSQTAIQHQNNWQESFAYDANGNKVSDTDANGVTQTWVYDYFGRVKSHVDLSGATTTYTYDANSGLLTSKTSNWAPAGQGNPGYIPGLWIGSSTTQNYTYYADGQVSQITQMTGSTTSAWDNYQYDVNGNQTIDATYTTDGAGQVVHSETITSYDSHNRINTVTTENPDNSVANTRTVYNYDAAGNRRAVFTQSAYGSNVSPISGNGGPPTTAGVGNQTATAGQSWNANVVGAFTDNIGFGLTFSGSGFPSWLSISGNGTLSGTPSTAGSWTVTVTATDVNGQSVSSSFVVTVPVAAPVFTAGASNQTGSVHGALSFTVPGATDANGSSLTYSATCNGGSLPSWLSFNAGTLTFSGTPPVGSIGSYTLAVKATAANGGVATESFTLTVAPTPPTYVGGVSNQTTFGGRAFSFAFASSDFNEADGDALSFASGSYSMSGSVETDSALPSWMSFAVSGGNLVFTGTPPTSVVGQTFNIYIKGTNPQGQTAEAYFSVAVNQYVQPAPVYNGGLANQTGVIGGSSITLNVPANSFVEPDGGGLTYSAMVLIPAHTVTVNKNGGPYDQPVAAQWVALSNVGLSVNATTGAISGVPTALTYLIANYSTPVYQRDGTYSLEVIATNGQGGQVAGSFTLTNSYAPPHVVNPMPAQTTNPAGAWSYGIPANTFSNAYGQGLTYTVSNLPSWMSFSNGLFNVNNAYYEPVGTYTITVTATDGLNQSGSTTLVINVPNVAPIFNGAASNVSGTQNSPFSYQPPGATDPNGDAVSYSAGYWNGSSWVGLPSWLSFNASTYTYSGTPPSAGSFTLALWATDSHGATTGESFTLTVAAAPQPPQYVGTMANQDYSYTAGGYVSINASGQFHDPQGQTLTYSAKQSNGNPLMSWLNFDPNTQIFSGTTPVNKGSADIVWTIQLTATDTSGLSSSFTFMIDAQGTGTAIVPLKGHGGKTSKTAATTATTQATPAPNTQSLWFTYDADNRVVVSNGTLVNGQIGIALGTYNSPSYANQYDAAGNVVVRSFESGGDSFLTSGGVWFTHTAGEQMTQQFYYDARNELVQTNYAIDTTRESSRGAQNLATYDAAGHLLSNNSYYRIGQVYDVTGMAQYPNGYYMMLSGWLQSGQVSTYNADGQVTAQAQFGRWGTNWTSLGIKDDAGTLPDESSSTPTIASDGALTRGGITTYTGFDHSDHVTDYTYYQPAVVQASTTDYGANYHVNYLKKDDYLEQSTSGTPTVTGYVPTTDTSYYDSFGRRMAVGQSSQQPSGTQQSNARIFAFDASGEILQSRSGTVSGTTFTPYGGSTTHHFTYVNGQEVDDVDEGGGINAASTLTGFTSGNGTENYLVQGGDTLASIAQSMYGNSSLGYVIAAANGFSSDNDLVTGQRITIPMVTTNSNTATTFRPYSPNVIVGSSTPTLVRFADLMVTAVRTMLSTMTPDERDAWWQARMDAREAQGILRGESANVVGSAEMSATALWIQSMDLEQAAAAARARGDEATADLISQMQLHAYDPPGLKLARSLVDFGPFASSGSVSQDGQGESGVPVPLSGLEELRAYVGQGSPQGSGFLAANGDWAAAGAAAGFEQQFNQVAEAVALGNAFGNSAIAGMNSTSTVQQGYQFDLANGALKDGSIANNDGSPGVTSDQSGIPDFREEDLRQIQQGANDEWFARTGELPDVGLSFGEQGRLATTTAWPYDHIDPYAIRRNDGIASGVEYTQTFHLPDQSPAMVTSLVATPEQSYRALSDADAFFAFNPAGQVMKGFGDRVNGLLSALMTPGVDKAATIAAITHYQSAYNNGTLGNTILTDVGGGVHKAIMASPIGLIKALNERQKMDGMYELGGSLFDAATYVAPLAGERLVAEGGDLLQTGSRALVDREVPNSVSSTITGATQASGSSEELVLVYRGTNRVAENSIYDETGHLMSDAGQRAYLESGSIESAYASSESAHQSWIDIWGSEEQYAQAHGAFGTELSPAFGVDRTFISVTTDPAQAAYFGQGGTLYSGYVPRSYLIQQTLQGAGESEFLLTNGTNLLKPMPPMVHP